MSNNFYKKCSRCKSVYGTGALADTLTDGQDANVSIEVYGKKYNLCPDCSYKLVLFLANNNQQ